MQKLPTPLAYQENFTIRTYETGQHKEATIAHLLKLMHESAMQNVLQLKVSVWDLESLNISWVLRHMELEINRLPKLGEDISIITYPAGFDRLFTYRDYRVLDHTGKEIAWASSKWLLMNTKDRKMASIPSFISSLPMPESKDCLPRPSNKLPSWQQESQSQNFQVTWHDLDFNGHLNNVIYINWMMEPLPREILANKKLHRLEIQYRAEAIWKEGVIAQVHPLDAQSYLHRLCRQSDGKELAKLMTKWK